MTLSFSVHNKTKQIVCFCFIIIVRCHNKNESERCVIASKAIVSSYQEISYAFCFRRTRVCRVNCCLMTFENNKNNLDIERISLWVHHPGFDSVFHSITLSCERKQADCLVKMITVTLVYQIKTCNVTKFRAYRVHTFIYLCCKLNRLQANGFV